MQNYNLHVHLQPNTMTRTMNLSKRTLNYTEVPSLQSDADLPNLEQTLFIFPN